MEFKGERKSTRADWWNYGWYSAYFITICTKNKEHFFGEIKDKKMYLSNLGAIADVLWHQLKERRNYVKLEEFVVMPNHIHGIIILDKPIEMQELIDNKVSFSEESFQKQAKKTISSIVGGYKSGLTKHANRMGLDSGWQVSFHDHIIRSEKSYENISNYILTNVENWEDDKFYT